jgi:hypothetical protein
MRLSAHLLLLLLKYSTVLMVHVSLLISHVHCVPEADKMHTYKLGYTLYMLKKVRCVHADNLAQDKSKYASTQERERVGEL